MNDYYKNIARKWMSAGVLFFNKEGKFLIVKPSYESQGWEIPGGFIELNESPITAVKREIKEELGLDIADPTLLCAEYHFNDPENRGDRIQFVFDGGFLTDEQVNNFVLSPEELKEFKFVTIEESMSLLGEKLHKRVPAAVQARNEKTIAYLEILK